MVVILDILFHYFYDIDKGPQCSFTNADTFCLEVAEKSLYHCVIPTVPLSGHAMNHTGFLQDLLIIPTRIMYSLITVEHGSQQRPAQG
jgi:hypothetical protein